jgi:hypothetical protein
MNPTEAYSRADVERWLGRREVAKGQAYLSSVSQLHIQPRLIAAQVQGTSPKPYRVRIHFNEDLAGGWRVSPECSCPVGFLCKHTAAVLLFALNGRTRKPRLSMEVLAWIEGFRETIHAPAARSGPRKPKNPQALFYVIDTADYGGGSGLRLFKSRTDKSGLPAGVLEEWHSVERALLQPPQFVSDSDLTILRLLWAQRPKNRYALHMKLDGQHGDEIMKRMLATGRLYFAREGLIPLAQGEERPGLIEWKAIDEGVLRAQVNATPPITLALGLDPLWYIDAKAGAAGSLRLSVAAPIVRRLLALPPLQAHEVPAVAAVLKEAAPEVPLPDVSAELREVDAPLVPVLRLGTLPVYGIYGFRGYAGSYQAQEFDYAVPSFRYGEIRFAAGDTSQFLTLQDGETVRVRRQPEAERQRLDSLVQYGFKKVPANAIYARDGRVPRLFYGLEREEAWPNFMLHTLPRMREAGWEVEIPPEFRHHILEVDAWHAEIIENESGWFDLTMGIEVQGKRMPLAPLLGALFRRDPRWLDAKSLQKMRDDEPVDLPSPDGARIRVEAGRLKPLARTLIDLFDAETQGPLRLSRFDAPRLAQLADLDRWQFRGMDAVQQLAQRLRAGRGVVRVAPPQGLALRLRTYQLEGLAWLQFLRENTLAGILADDMGLGKTAQTLAHLLLEKEAGRLTQPALIVLPTSLIHNWRSEATRFAPRLSLLALHGPDRLAHFENIPHHDMVLTTYPLLWRDGKALAEHEYHLLILDEAQMVKNAQSEAAKMVRKLRARHRLCLTGTPLENHLGELWAQFDFLMPGFLGDPKQFQRSWRTPIEKGGDSLRRELLARRIRPFILRRRKEDVAKELPEKTQIVRSVELQAGQRDLYEAVRSAMDARVREEIASKGFKRSQIVILDALLKLRQVCCDPRLLKSEGARATRERAKLALLMDMLPELVDEGRRILLFSQFTSMLELIAQELVRAKIPYVTLTGDTNDRVAPISRFQAGEVPLFLISLKAGGVGLNLTAADTVIHFDPWWNPAVENQATDRAHRIGQTKRVFVYKLIVAGSIEEKILALQEKKAELAAGILSEDHAGEIKFDEKDIEALLAPLPALEKAT